MAGAHGDDADTDDGCGDGGLLPVQQLPLPCRQQRDIVVHQGSRDPRRSPLP